MALRSVTPSFYLLLAGLALLGVGSVLHRGDRGQRRRAILTSGWIVLGGFWAAVGVGRIAEARPFLGVTALLTACICVYVGSLSYRSRDVADRFSEAFLAMGAIYVPFQYLEPVYRTLVEFVAATTNVGLWTLGYYASVTYGFEGNRNVITVASSPSQDPITFGIASACTGISAMALFVGLVYASDAPWKRRAGGIVFFGSLIFVLNIVRNVFTIVAYREHTFAFLASTPVADAFQTDTQLLSYYVAEQVVSPVYISVGALLGYWLLVVVYPSIGSTVDALVDSLRSDVSTVVAVREP